MLPLSFAVGLSFSCLLGIIDAAIAVAVGMEFAPASSIIALAAICPLSFSAGTNPLLLSLISSIFEPFFDTFPLNSDESPI